MQIGGFAITALESPRSIMAMIAIKIQCFQGYHALRSLLKPDLLEFIYGSCKIKRMKGIKINEA